ncbi:restriction endonuclease subunit S [Geothrix sp. PMB-07]|uniref:restriction endonuclease subunit S n=1 Tax=Geothrix sp. PMB-07 TaxID=3068640 RepID=UPI002741B3CC|nr:restriction endonuclease subunit S [Geothrix sp. PMB-07]WLT30878.1 restriction endonuclease subunit S [Geothrix sp. PMB-07]
MEVRPGGKQTEMGVFPKDWNEGSLKDLVDPNRTIRYGIVQPGKFDPQGRFMIRGQDYSRGWVEPSELFRVSPTVEKPFENARVITGDVLITIVGASTGRIAIVPDWLDGANLTQTTARVALRREQINAVYCSYVLASSLGAKQVANYLKGAAQPGLNCSDIEKFRIPLPHPTEQQSIATALSDMDALLEGLDRLIAKKRDLKQAAMQQLLTGQTRLPGFSGQWEVKLLGDHVTFLRNGVNSRAELRPEGQVKYLHYGDIHASTGSILSPQALPSLPDAKATRLDRLRDGDLIFADASEDIAGVCKSVELRDTRDIEVVSGLHTIAARFDKTVLADGFKGFLQYCPTFASHLRRHAAGTKVLATNRAHIASVEMRLPDVAEQEAIAAVLSDMDSELVALEARRDKTRALKLGMMQELLTGRIRLVESVTGASEQPASQADGQQANIHFKRSVLAAEIIDRLHAEPTFGHVKFEKVMFLVEHLCAVDTGSTYLRKAAGPYDNRALRSIDSQLRKQQWFDCRKEGERYRYLPMAHWGGHKHYFERYFADITDTFENVLQTFKTLETERCEIVATLLSAWSDLLQTEGPVSDERIVHEVLNNWHKSKERIPKDRWLKALGWMRSRGFVPKEGA